MLYFLPYRIDRPFYMPWATIALICTNLIVFALSLVFGLDATIDALGFRMDLLAPITWLSASFLHAGVGHIVGNMYFLWLFGSTVEDALGPWRMVGLYLAGGLVSALVHGMMMVLFVPAAADIPVIGASGALAAIMGLFAVRFYKTKIRVAYFAWIFMFIRYGTFAISSVFGIALYFVSDLVSGLLQIALGSVGGVANWAHLGGVAFGVGLGLLSGQVRGAATEYLAEEAQQLSAPGMHDAAAAKYATLAEKDPDNPEWHRRAARELAQHDVDEPGAAAAGYCEAVTLLVRGRNVPEAFDTYIESEGVCAPLSLESSMLLSLAGEAERRGAWTDAEKIYLRIIEERSGTPAAEKSLFRLAHVYLGMKAPDRAAVTWGAFHDLHPDSELNAFADPALRLLESA